MRRMRFGRVVGVACAVVCLVAPTFGARADGIDPCAPRLLILSAFPGELDPILSRASVTDSIELDGRAFYVGSLEGNDVIMAMTGIGMNNADTGARAALDHFTCAGSTSITGIVFSGVSGGRTSIGDVTIPGRWHDGTTFFDVDAEMLTVAQSSSASVQLARDVPVGDVACVGTDPDVISSVSVEHQPAIIIGGDGQSSDPFGGRTLPCFPGGGDVFGCRPCRAPLDMSPDVERFVSNATPFIDPNFFFDYFANQPTTNPAFDATDMETAAVARVADQTGIPFIAFRALSDGLGDPLMLPGFPFQFFFYRQLAADNAGAVTVSFLRAWASR